MKHLAKFNEDVSNEPRIVKEYIAECFIEFLDNGSQIELFHYDDEYTVEIMIPKDEEPSIYSASKEIERIIKRNEDENEVLSNALLCIERVKNRYKRIYYVFSNNSSSYEIRFDV